MYKSVLICVVSIMFFLQKSEAQLTHIKGMQSVGARFGIGVKNEYAMGLTYTYSINQKTNLIVELDREIATFGNSDFTNDILFSPGIEYSVWNPVKWFLVYSKKRVI